MGARVLPCPACLTWYVGFWQGTWVSGRRGGRWAPEWKNWEAEVSLGLIRPGRTLVVKKHLCLGMLWQCSAALYGRQAAVVVEEHLSVGD